jgi:hypothetical protein
LMRTIAKRKMCKLAPAARPGSKTIQLLSSSWRRNPLQRAISHGFYQGLHRIANMCSDESTGQSIVSFDSGSIDRPMLIWDIARSKADWTGHSTVPAGTFRQRVSDLQERLAISCLNQRFVKLLMGCFPIVGGRCLGGRQISCRRRQLLPIESWP